MEQMNKTLLADQKDKEKAVESSVQTEESGLLGKVRENYGYFAGISGTFGLFYVLLFYKADLGVNVLGFVCVMIGLLYLVSMKLGLPQKKGTLACYLGAFLLAGACVWSANETIWFFNIVGILLLLNLSLIHQFHEDREWGILRYLRKMGELGMLSVFMAGEPFKGGVTFLKRTRTFKNEKGRNIVVGILIALPLLFLVVGLLSSADLLFGSVTKGIYEIIFSSDIFYVSLFACLSALFCFCVIYGSGYQAAKQQNSDERKKAAAAILVTVLSLLCAVYLVFCGIQVMYLFAGGWFMLPETFTYAEYARQGFFELLAVTVINLLIMVVAGATFEDTRVTRILLTILTACTFCMIGSAGYRMVLYIGAYNLTFLRLAVLLFLAMDALVLGGMILSVYRKQFPIFGYCVVVVTVCYLVFAYARPDYLIASYHVNHEAQLTEEDLNYLTQTLSEDAAPIVQILVQDPVYSQKIWWDVELHNARGFNVSNYMAYQLHNQ